MRLAGQHALITGGGTGIGAAIAYALAGEGARLTLVGRRVEPLKRTAAELAAAGFADIYFTTVDVIDPRRVAAAFSYARDRNKRISLLVNNAGAASSAPFAKSTADAWRAALAVNLDGVFNCCQAALPDLLSGDTARIVTIASTAGLQGYPYTAAYVAAKHGAVGLTRALAAEFTGTGLTVNAVCPGFTDTDLVAGAAEQIRAKTGRSLADARAALAGLNRHGRLVTPEEVAAKALWLCLPEQQGVTGEAIVVDGSGA